MEREQKRKDLRKKAEEKVDNLVKKNLDRIVLDTKGKELLHELQVHMIELAMQNEQLMDGEAALAKEKRRYQALYDSAPACYLTLDRDGYIIEANQTAASVFNVPLERVLGQPFQKFLTAGSADTFHLFLRNVLPPGEKVVLDLRFQPQKDSPAFPILVSITAEHERGKLARYLLVFVDSRWPKPKI